MFNLRDKNFGRYEKRLCVLLLLATIPNAFPPLQFLVTQYTPTHHCDVASIYNVTNEQQASLLGFDVTKDWNAHLINVTVPMETDQLGVTSRSSCEYYNMTSQQLKLTINGSLGNVTLNKTTCSEYYFYGEEVSAVTEFGMVCSSAWQKPLTTSVYMLGLLCGGVFGGMLSDAFGRRKVFLIFTLLQYVTVLCASFVNDVISHGIVTFVLGIVALANFVAAFLLATEFLPPGVRALGYFSVEVGFSLGSILISLLAFLLPHWRSFLRVTGVIGVIYIPYYWLIDESPQWLAASGSKEKAEQVIRKVANFNNKTRSNEELDKIADTSEETETLGICSTFFQLFSNFQIFRRMSIVFFSWFVVSIAYFAMKLNLNKLSGDRFINILFGGITELAATFLFYFAVETRGRKQSYMISMSLAAIFIVMSSLLTSVGSLSTVLSMLGQLLLSVSFNVVYIFTSELFPTKSRQSVLGLSAVGARVGGFIAPYLIYAGDSGSTLAPSIGTSAVIILSVLSSAFLPETRGAKLPQTVQEALDLPGGIDVTNCKRGRKIPSDDVKKQDEEIL